MTEVVGMLGGLDDIQSSTAGGKARSLDQMIKAGFDVPPGFVITNMSKGEMNSSLKSSILSHFDELGADLVAVRSSATAEDSESASWAGQLETFLNINRENLIDSVEKCWASINSERARAYAESNKVETSAADVAVIVQSMVQADVSGVAFSVHPVTKSTDSIVIEAAYGLCEAVVSGEVTPDTYMIAKCSLEISDKYISNQTRKLVRSTVGTKWVNINDVSNSKLDDDQIAKLASHVSKIEDHYGYPVDVEWSIIDNEIHILQARPITTIKNKE